jgi:D-alanyl-D-alanine carboxypeptidase (penicillin-binding protein 5/6)
MISPLEEGARRRRFPRFRRGPGRGPGRVLPGLLALLAAGAVATAAWLALADQGSGGGTPAASAPPLLPQKGGRPQTPASNPPPPGSPAAVALEGVDAFDLTFHDPPRGGIVFDVRTGDVLWRHNPAKKLPVASLTKIMTALLVAERTNPREHVRITRAALRYRGSGVGVLPRRRRVPIEGLLHGMLMISGNDAAIALAVHVSGTERRFVRLMNRRARQLGLTCSRFVSSYGLQNRNRSCAADLAALARLAMGERRIARIVRKRQAAVRFPIKGRRLFLGTTNPLLRTGYPGTIGLKTGYTRRAGRCFVGIVRHGRRMLGVVLLGSPNPNRQSRKLLAKAFRAGV